MHMPRLTGTRGGGGGAQVLTGDLGGTAKCSEFTKAVCDRIALGK
jgi:hypothetical protein